MATLTFDTFRFANRLKSAGVIPAQAEAEAEALSEVLEINLKEVATRQDVHAIKEDIRREIKELELRMDGELKPIKWMLGVVTGGIMALVVKAFFPG
jgi:hypothetical protein